MPLVVSQRPEQHCAPLVQVPPNAVHKKVASPLLEESPAPDDPPSPEELPVPELLPDAPELPPEDPLELAASVNVASPPLPLEVLPSLPPPPASLLGPPLLAPASPDVGVSPLVPQSATANAKTHKATLPICLFISLPTIRAFSLDHNSETGAHH